MTMPKTSANAMMTRISIRTEDVRTATPSGEFIFLLFEKIWADKLPDAAIEMIPKKRHWGEKKFALRKKQPAISPNRKEKLEPIGPIMLPAREYRKNRPMFVLRPETKMKMTQAIRAIAYNSWLSRKIPSGKPGRAVPPRTEGPMITPASSSPRNGGTPNFFAIRPQHLAAKNRMKSCITKRITAADSLSPNFIVFPYPIT
jgi:hypothetical protein